MNESNERAGRELTLMARVALTRLHRFARVADAAERSDSPVWRGLARLSAEAAMRDCLRLALADAAPARAPAQAA